jgi:hypothetical protein
VFTRRYLIQAQTSTLLETFDVGKAERATASDERHVPKLSTHRFSATFATCAFLHNLDFLAKTEHAANLQNLRFIGDSQLMADNSDLRVRLGEKIEHSEER